MRVAIAGGRLAGLPCAPHQAELSSLPVGLAQSTRNVVPQVSGRAIPKGFQPGLRVLARSITLTASDFSESLLRQLQHSRQHSVVKRYRSSFETFKTIPIQVSSTHQTDGFRLDVWMPHAYHRGDNTLRRYRVGMEEGVLSGKLTAQAISSCINAPRVAADALGFIPIQIAA